MSIWDDFIAINETEIVRLRETINLMKAGNVEMRMREGDEWGSQNERRISEDRATIDRLERLIERAKSVVSSAGHPSQARSGDAPV